MSRRVLTKSTIDELIAAGEKEVLLDERDIVTALAKEYAQQRGVRLVPAANAKAARISQAASAAQAEPTPPAPAACPAPAAAGPAAAPEPDPALEPIPDDQAVRKAVIAAVGFEPAGLDAVISRVME